MKKLSYLIVLLSLTVGSAMAQEIQTEEITLKKVKKGEMPEEVLKSVEKDFPDTKAVEYAMLPIDQYNDQWAIVAEHSNMKPGEKPQFYQIDAPSCPWVISKMEIHNKKKAIMIR